MNIRTLVELYDDECPLENVLGAEVFRPEQVVYICPADTPEEVAGQMRDYFAHRDLQVRVRLVRVNPYRVRDVLGVFRGLLKDNRDVMVDITGGTDDVLFAAGIACSEYKTPVVTYSKRKNRFFSVQNAEEYDDLLCDRVFTVDDCFRMAGGTVRMGRVDNRLLSKYMDLFDPFFSLYMRYRSHWDRTVSYIQRLSAADAEGRYSLDAEGPWEVKGERGSRLIAPAEALRDMETIGMIQHLKMDPQSGVSFRFRDAQIRTWLRDVGSVLELYTYKACFDSGLFDDVRTSTVVDWQRENPSRGAVSNELDVMCTRRITPVFISCKTCMIHTEALNELAVLRDRFGGKLARAAIVSTANALPAARNRAAELNIRVIDLSDLRDGGIHLAIRQLMKGLL